MKTLKSLSKGLGILELFLTDGNEMAVRDIAEISGLNKVTVSRIASTLAEHGFLKQRKRKGKYSLGVRFLDLGGVISNEPRSESGMASYLVELSRLVNESIYLTIWYGSNILLTRSFDFSADSPAITPNDWSTMPLHHTCVGKIVLANMSDDDLKKYFRYKLERKTNHTMVDLDRMNDELSYVKRENIAFEEEEARLGVSGVAAGIKNSEGATLGAVFIIGPSIRLDHAVLRKIAPSVKICALKISLYPVQRKTILGRNYNARQNKTREKEYKGS